MVFNRSGETSLRTPAQMRARTTTKPPAVFPDGVATDADLLIAQNRVVTSLTRAISASDSTITLADSTAIGADMTLSLDRDGEIVKVTGGGGQTFTVWRGFDGTLPVAHAAGSIVLGNKIAFHHNALVAEIQAIEKTLGPHLRNVGDLVVSSGFDFCQQPGGNLVAGSNTITLTPVPPGINGTNQNHYLRISGGTSIAESVLIMGGTAAEGAPSGTVIVNCAYARSGSWIICSATSGIAEAIVSLHGPGSISVPTGNWPVYATIAVPPGISISGAGIGATVVSLSPDGASTIPLFKCIGDLITIRDMYLFQVGSPSASGVAGADSHFALFQNLLIDGFANGLYLTTSRIRVFGCVLMAGAGGAVTPQANAIYCDGNFNTFSNNSAMYRSYFKGNHNIITDNFFNETSNTSPCVNLAAGDHFTFTDNHVLQNGTAPSLQIDAGVTVRNGSNVMFGSFVNNGTNSPMDVPIFGSAPQNAPPIGFSS